MNVPKLRFSEFSGVWEEKNFEDIFSFSTGKNIKQNEASPEFETPCVRYGELYHMYGEVISKIINRTNLDKSELLFSKGNEILLPSAGEDPLDIGSASALTVANVAIGRTINILRPLSDNVYSQKYAAYYINQKLRKKISTLAKGVSISNVYNSDLKKLSINLPCLSEQEKIASFLTSLDTKIEQLTKKKALLEEYKKGVMQKIFAQEIRFRDDDGSEYPEWVEKKLGTVVSAINNGLSLTQNSEKSGYKVSRIETISDANINLNKVGYVTTDLNISNYKLEIGDMLFSNINSVKHIGKIAYVDKDYDLYHGMNLLNIKVDRTSNYPKFIYYFLTSKKYKTYFERICNQAVSQASINQTDLKKTKLLLPSLKEQTKIANFLSSLDSKLLHVEKQLSSTKEFKKALLQQMFV